MIFITILKNEHPLLLTLLFESLKYMLLVFLSFKKNELGKNKNKKVKVLVVRHNNKDNDNIDINLKKEKISLFRHQNVWPGLDMKHIWKYQQSMYTMVGLSPPCLPLPSALSISSFPNIDLNRYLLSLQFICNLTKNSKHILVYLLLQQSLKPSLYLKIWYPTWRDMFKIQVPL